MKKSIKEMLENNTQMKKILENNEWYLDGVASFGRAGKWLNLYWYSYPDREDSPVWTSDEEVKTQITFFRIWDKKREQYTRVGILPDGNMVMFAGTNENHPWGLAPGTKINCKSYSVLPISEIAVSLGFNGYDLMELVALRCACY